MKYYIALLLVLSLCLTGCFAGTPSSSQPTVPAEEAKPTGWMTEADQTFYINKDGSIHIGWLELDGKRYYLDNMGVLQTGWLEHGNNTYYLQADGSAARGKVVIDDRVYYFTSTGARIIIANPWTIIPSDYSPNLRNTEGGMTIDKSCKDSLDQMLADCRAAGHGVVLISAFRENSTQIYLYNRKVNYYLDLGLDAATARKEAGKVVAMPGTSEHELGLAVDLVDSDYTELDEAQENTDTQKWLMENCWKYGFILRYPNDKSDKTGIIYEPWHYRYVGTAVAQELYESGLCLEEYLEQFC